MRRVDGILGVKSVRLKFERLFSNQKQLLQNKLGTDDFLSALC